MKMELHRNRLFIAMLLLGCSCGRPTGETPQEERETKTPVTVTTASIGVLTETLELNATSSFLLKSPVKSMVNGYLQNVRIRQGDYVKKGDVLMSVITKEAQTLGGAISRLDTSFHFKGEISLAAPGSGYISQLNFQSGDYVQDGEQIATISDDKSFVFILELPYELTPLLKSNKNVQVVLPDSSTLDGTIEKPMPTVDPASQTQNYLISVPGGKMIPENLVAKVRLVKSSRSNATTLPKEALLTDETQSSYWVMKLMNDSTAVKWPVQKGIESGGRVEILSPPLSASDRILLTGNFGLPDTAKVILTK